MSDLIQPEARETVHPVVTELRRKKAEIQKKVRERRAEQAIKDETFDDTNEEKQE